MKVRYVGPFDEVELPSLNLLAHPGDVLDVPDWEAENLSHQSDWELVDAPYVAPEPEAQPAEAEEEVNQ